MSLGTLTVDLLMKTGKFETDAKRAEKLAKEMAKKIDATVSKVGTALASAAAIGFGAFAVGVKSAIDAADQMGEAAEKIGVTTEALSELSFAAKLSAVEQETLQKALAKVSVDLTKQDSLLRTLGVTATTADGALAQLADKFQEMPDGLEKTAAAAKIFGERIGPDLVPLLNRGSEGIEQLREQARNLGITLSTDTAKAAGEFNDKMDILKASVDGAWRSIATQMLPSLESFALYLQDVSKNAELMNDLDRSFKAIAKTIQFAVDTVQALTLAIAGLDELLQATSFRNLWGEIMGERSVTNAFDRVKVAFQSAAEAYDNPDYSPTVTKSNSRGVRGGVSMDGTIVPMRKRSAGPGLDSILGGNESATSKAAKAARENNDAQREAKRLEDERVATLERLNSVLNYQAGEIGGPLVKAAQDYSQTMVELSEVENDLIRLGKLDEEAQIKLRVAREQATKTYEDQTEAIQSLKTPAEEDLERMRQEVELLGLSNKERAKKIFLLNNPNATPAQVDQAGIYFEQAEQLDKTKQALDQFRSSATDAFASFLDGSMSAKDAFEAFADSVVQQIARILAEQAIAALFGGQGTTGGGSFGGMIGSFFGSIFGGGRASGGAVLPGRSYRVNENGPEILTYQGKDYLMTGSGGGMVKPTAGGANITVNVAPTTDRRTAQQIAQRIAEKQNTAVMRNK